MASTSLSMVVKVGGSVEEEVWGEEEDAMVGGYEWAYE